MIARENPSSSPAPKPAPRRGIGRFTLDMRQAISPAKQAGILAGSLAIGLIISVAILDQAGIAPLDLARELAGVFNADTILAKHDETYMPKEVADALKKSGHWQDPSTRPLARPAQDEGAAAAAPPPEATAK